jgi:hypothetical protein
MCEPDLHHIRKRFLRLLGNEKAESGVGWSIVRRTALVLGAHIKVG